MSSLNLGFTSALTSGFLTAGAGADIIFNDPRYSIQRISNRVPE